MQLDSKTDHINKHTINAELHCHANRKQRLGYFPLLYDSVQTEEEIINECIKKNIKILAITDHDSLEGFRIAQRMVDERDLDLLLIPACEVTVRGGHILAYNVTKEISPGLQPEKAIEEIHKQDGLAVAAHPYMVFSYGDHVYNLNFDAIEGYNSSIPDIANHRAVIAATKLNLPIIAGSDSHQLNSIGNCVTYFPANVKSVKDIIVCLKEGNFSVTHSQDNTFAMLLRHFYKN